MKSIQLRGDVFEAFEEAVNTIVGQIKNGDTEYKESLKKELSQVERKISNYLSRIGQTESEALMENYEKKILECESTKKKLLIELEKDLKNV